MALRISDLLGVSNEQLQREGAFDGFVDLDSQFHIDPFLLRHTKTPEMKDSYERFRTHFKEVITLLDHSTDSHDRFFKEAKKKLIFKEKDDIHLGYCNKSNPGKGIGPGLAQNIATDAKKIVDAGVKDPAIFELIGLLEEGIGADRISDMTAKIIYTDLLVFSERVARNLKMKTYKKRLGDTDFLIPYNPKTGRSIVMIPKDVLRHLPVALDWDEIDTVCSYNDELRHRVNSMIGKTWKEAQAKHNKKEIKDAILNYPNVLKNLIRLYEEKKGKEYDFEQDPEGLLIWYDISKKYVEDNPLNLLSLKSIAKKDVMPVVVEICEKFKRLVEYGGLNELLYENGKLRHERFPQRLFYGIADSYCEANDLDISREPDDGRGAVDFKISKGYKSKVTVEIKYSSNPNLIRGFEKQLPEYNLAENTDKSIYLILQKNKFSASVNNVLKKAQKAKERGEKVPEIVVVDITMKPSASKMK